MKAILVREVGHADKLLYDETGDPVPSTTDLLVSVEAAGVNYIDTYHRGGLYPIELPFTPGLEGAGVVTAVGEEVSDFGVGDRVGWAQALGSYAEKNVVASANAVPVPAGVDLRTAAAVLLQGITAHYLAIDTYPLGNTDTCLIHAGAGGVGLLLTQIAKMRGATVVTTVGTEAKAGLSRSAGADHVINYAETDFGAAVEEIFGPNHIDVVYDGVGKSTFNVSIDLLRPRGTMVTFGNASGPVPEISPLLLAQKGSIFLTRPTMAHYLQTRFELLGRTNDLFTWVESGDLQVTIGAEFPLEQAAAAHVALEGRQTTGKVLLIP